MNHTFEVGERVVHPQHGVGYVSALEDKRFGANHPRRYYVVSIEDTTLWVPVDSSTSGLRKLGLRSDLDRCRQVLQSAPVGLTPDRGLLASLTGRINQGTIMAQCEVVRDLAAFSWHKPLYGPLADFQRNIMSVLCQEWAAVAGSSPEQAAREIASLLDRDRAAYEH